MGAVILYSQPRVSLGPCTRPHGGRKGAPLAARGRKRLLARRERADFLEQRPDLVAMCIGLGDRGRRLSVDEDGGEIVGRVTNFVCPKRSSR